MPFPWTTILPSDDAAHRRLLRASARRPSTDRSALYNEPNFASRRKETHEILCTRRRPGVPQAGRDPAHRGVGARRPARARHPIRPVQRQRLGAHHSARGHDAEHHPRHGAHRPRPRRSVAHHKRAYCMRGELRRGALVLPRRQALLARILPQLRGHHLPSESLPQGRRSHVQGPRRRRLPHRPEVRDDARREDLWHGPVPASADKPQGLCARPRAKELSDQHPVCRLQLGLRLPVEQPRRWPCDLWRKHHRVGGRVREGAS